LLAGLGTKQAFVGCIGRFRQPVATLCGQIGPFFCSRSGSGSDSRKKLNRAICLGGRTGSIGMAQQEITFIEFLCFGLGYQKTVAVVQNIKRLLVSDGYTLCHNSNINSFVNFA
jgi:hypothetical protein